MIPTPKRPRQVAREPFLSLADPQYIACQRHKSTEIDLSSRIVARPGTWLIKARCWRDAEVGAYRIPAPQ